MCKKGFNFVTGSIELNFPQGKREARFFFDMEDGEKGCMTTLQVKEPTGWKHGTLSDFKVAQAFLKGKDNVLAGVKNFGWMRTSRLPRWVMEMDAEAEQLYNDTKATQAKKQKGYKQVLEQK
jgi:hypothetical protein